MIELIDFSRGTEKRERVHFPVFLPSPFSEITFFPIRDFQDLLFQFSLFLPSFFLLP